MFDQSSLFTSAAASLLFASLSQAQMTLSPSASVPSGASPTVNPAFPAYAFEERSFYSFSNYTLSQNLLAQAANRTNSRPAIRVGGNSLNTANYVTDPSTSIIIPEAGTDRSIPLNITLGPAFWDCFKNFPEAQYIVNLPMNDFAGIHGSDVNTTVTMAQDAWNTIGSNNIIAIELGNEPNSYSRDNYQISDYVTQFQQYSDAVSQTLGFSSNDPIYVTGDLSYPAVGNWNAQNMFSAGLSSMTSEIASFAPHFYQLQDRQEVTLQNLLNHTRMTHQVAIYVPQIQYVNGLTPSIPFDFGETACSVGQIANPSYVLERALGAALWQVDFMLYTMTLGVNRVHMQSGYGFEFGLWQPASFDNQTAGVYANYYAQLFVGDFIGRSGKMQAIELDTGDSSDTLTAYAAYEAGALKRVAITNLGYFDGTQQPQSQRTSQSFSIAVPAGVSSVVMQTFTAPNGATEVDTNNITWAGNKYTLDNEGLAQNVGPASTSLPINNGHVMVNVEQSQAVMVYFGNSTSSALTSSSATASATRTGTATAGTATAVVTGTATGSAASASATHKSAATAVRGQGQTGVVAAAFLCVVLALVTGI